MDFVPAFKDVKNLLSSVITYPVAIVYWSVVQTFMPYN